MTNRPRNLSHQQVYGYMTLHQDGRTLQSTTKLSSHLSNQTWRMAPRTQRLRRQRVQPNRLRKCGNRRSTRRQNCDANEWNKCWRLFGIRVIADRCSSCCLNPVTSRTAPHDQEMMNFNRHRSQLNPKNCPWATGQLYDNREFLKFFITKMPENLLGPN